MRQTLKMEQEFSQNGTGPFWSTLWLRFGWIPGLSSSATPEGAAVTRSAGVSRILCLGSFSREVKLTALLFKHSVCHDCVGGVR